MKKWITHTRTHSMLVAVVVVGIVLVFIMVEAMVKKKNLVIDDTGGSKD